MAEALTTFKRRKKASLSDDHWILKKTCAKIKQSHSKSGREFLILISDCQHIRLVFRQPNIDLKIQKGLSCRKKIEIPR